MIPAPCKDCEARRPRCHSCCAAYVTWAQDRRIILDLRYVTAGADEVQINAINKIKKRRNK